VVAGAGDEADVGAEVLVDDPEPPVVVDEPLVSPVAACWNWAKAASSALIAKT
jgi:hypothetical protein